MGKITYLIGIDFLEPQNLNRRLYSCMVLASFVFICTTYTLFITRDDKKKFVEVSLMLFFSGQEFMRFPFHVVDRFTVTKINDIVLKLYTEAEKNLKHEKEMRKCLELIRKTLKALLVFYFVCLMGPIVYNFFSLLFLNNLNLLFPFTIPFVETATRKGYLINLTFQVYLTFCGCIGISGSEVSNIFITMQLKAFVDSFKCSLDDLGAEISKKFQNSRKNKLKIRKMMVNVIEKHADIRKYQILVQKRMTKVAFLAIILHTYTLCACGIAIFSNKYYTAAGIACMSYMQLFIICAIGSFLCHQHKRLMQITWSFDWFKLDKFEQKNYLILLGDVQNPLTIEPAFIGVIDMELFVNVRKIFQ